MDVESRVLAHVGQSCPLPVPHKLAIAREYGVIYLEWASSTPYLYVRASTYDDTEHFEIAGVGIEPFSTDGEDAAEYTHGKMFAGNAFYESPPRTEAFSLYVTPVPGSPQQFVDQIELEFDTVQCTCVYRDW